MSENNCFVIAPIGLPDSETRKRSDQILKHIIRPAAKLRGYNAIRADEISEPGIITSQVIQLVVDAPLVIADLTEHNPNVFYELALRHALRKPLVQIIAKGENIPFDVAGMRTIPVDHHDLDSVEEAKAEISRQIEAVEKPGARIETPISVAVNLQSLRQSDNPDQRILSELLAGLIDLRMVVAGISKRLAEPDFLTRAVSDPESFELFQMLRQYGLFSSPNQGALDEMRRRTEELEEKLREQRKKLPSGKK